MKDKHQSHGRACGMGGQVCGLPKGSRQKEGRGHGVKTNPEEHLHSSTQLEEESEETKKSSQGGEHGKQRKIHWAVGRRVQQDEKGVLRIGREMKTVPITPYVNQVCD